MASAALLGAGLFEVGFFAGFGFEFIELISSSDLFRRAIIFIRLAILLPAITYLPLWQVIKDFSPLDEESFDNPWRYWIVYIVKATAFGAMVINSLYSTVVLEFEPLHFVLLFVSILAALLGFSRAARSIYMKITPYFDVFLFSLALFLAGLSAGRNAHLDHKFNAFIKNSEATYRAHIIRRLERGLIFYADSGTVIFVPWDDIKYIEQSGTKIDKKSIYTRLGARLSNIWHGK